MRLQCLARSISQWHNKFAWTQHTDYNVGFRRLVFDHIIVVQGALDDSEVGIFGLDLLRLCVVAHQRRERPVGVLGGDRVQRITPNVASRASAEQRELSGVATSADRGGIGAALTQKRMEPWSKSFNVNSAIGLSKTWFAVADGRCWL